MKRAIIQNLMPAAPAGFTGPALQIRENNHVLIRGTASHPENQPMVTKSFKTKLAVLEKPQRKPPDLYASLLQLLAKYGISGQELSIGIAGFTGSTARAYLAEIGLAGTIPGFYNLHLGGNPTGDRLNKIYRINLSETELLNELNSLLAAFKITRKPNESFGDFSLRKQLI